MTRSLIISSLLCSALVIGCGEDKHGATGNTATNNTPPADSGDEEDSASDTGGNPTTGDASGKTDDTGIDSQTDTGGSNTTPPTSDSDPSSGDVPGETSGGSTGCSFICETTGSMGGQECDNFAQDCADGEKCVAWAEGGGGSWNATKCVKVTGSGQHGDVCMTEGGGTSGIDDCDKGVMCWNVDENNAGTCVALCTGSAEAPKCIDNLPCTIANEGVLNLCLPSCDPLLQDCPGDDLCIPNGDNFVCVLDASGEEGQAHDVCEFANACDKGLVCLDTMGASSECDPAAAGCCEPFCEFPDGACPAADQQCVQWFDPATLPMDDPKLEIGVCRIPK